MNLTLSTWLPVVCIVPASALDEAPSLVGMLPSSHHCQYLQQLSPGHGQSTYCRLVYTCLALFVKLASPQEFLWAKMAGNQTVSPDLSSSLHANCQDIVSSELGAWLSFILQVIWWILVWDISVWWWGNMECMGDQTTMVCCCCQERGLWGERWDGCEEQRKE